MSQRSTLLSRLEAELRELDERIRIKQDAVSRLQAEKKSLMSVIDTMRESIKKSAATVTTMTRRKSQTPATA
jgi:prefoldin subunit 5